MINAGDTVGDSIEAAQTVIQHDPSGEFTQYIDAELAKWIHEETSLIKNDFPNAGLYEVAWSADFIVGFPDPSNLSALPQTKKQIEDANTTLVSGINTAIQRLNKLAIESIMASGTSYDEVDIILDSGFSLAENFEAAGFTEQSEQLLGETISYIETIIETGLNGFKAELEKTEFSAQQVADLQQQASAFDDLSKQFSGFSAYKQAIETVLETNKATICKNLLLDSGAGKSDFEKPIMIGGETLSLAELNCNLYEQGSSIARISSKFLSDTYDISIANSDGAVSEYRFKTDKTLANQALSVRSTITESEEQPISQEQWSEFISSLVQPPPSGEPDTNGVRECDLLAADPHDPQKLSPGIDFTTDDIDLDAFERGIDACIAAVEHDPEDARQIYQLGRLLWYAGDQEMAKDYIEVAAQANYAPAIYYNAEMMLSLSDDPDAFIDALELYETSGKLGYARGSDMVRELNPDGIEFFKEIPPPTGAEIVASLKQKGKSVSVFGMTTSVRVVDAKIKDCFQTSATDFSCEYKKIAKCGVSGWGNDPMVGFLSRAMQSDCNGAPYTFGSFRKLAQGSWKELPSQF